MHLANITSGTYRDYLFVLAWNITLWPNPDMEFSVLQSPGSHFVELNTMKNTSDRVVFT